MDFETTKWLIGLLVIVILAILGIFFKIWWNVEHKQDKALCALKTINAEEHKELRKKIDGTREALADQHVAILGKIDNVYQYLLNGNQKKRSGG